MHRSLKVRLLTTSPGAFSNSPELMMLEIGCPGAEFLIFTTVYTRSKAIFFKDFVDVLSRYSFAYKNIFIGGDLNCNLLAAGFEATSLRESVAAHVLNIVASNSTFHTATADSWLDVFIVDSSTKVLSFRKSEAPFIAGQDLLESYRFESPPNLVRAITHRSFRGFIDSDYYHDFFRRAFDAGYPRVPNGLSFLFQVDSFFDSLRNSIVLALNEQAPLRSFPIHRHPTPWLSVVCKEHVRE